MKKTVEVQITYLDIALSKQEYLDTYLGEVLPNPRSVVNRYNDLSRQLGKTYTLLKALPERELILCTHNTQMFRHHILRELSTLRPTYDVRFIHNITYDELKKADFDRNQIKSLRGKCYLRSAPMFFDNAVLDQMQLDFVSKMNVGVKMYDV